MPLHPQRFDTAVELQDVSGDVAELRAKLAALHADHRRIVQDLELRNAALDAAPTLFLIADASVRRHPIVYVNRALAERHGYASATELIGHSVGLLLEAIPAAERAEMSAELAAGRTVRREVELSSRTGERFWVGFATIPLRDAAGKIAYFVSLGADITTRRQRDRRERELQEQLRLAQKLESVGRLASGLAHEINTPIQYVGDSVHFLRTTFTDLTALLDAYRAAVVQLAGGADATAVLTQMREHDAAADVEFLSREVPRAFERTQEGVERVTAIVRAMKEFAYPDASEQARADLNRALTTTLTVAHSEYKHIATVTTAFGELPDVMCSIGELNQVFLNLIVNAAHAIHDAGRSPAEGRIHIETRMHGALAQIAIRDNGCGIAAENARKIFDPFFTTKEVGRGTGQGLALVRSFIYDRHNGQIDVTSELGVGTTFTISLPLHGRPKASG